MNSYKYLAILLVSLFSITGMAQQVSNYSFYRYTMNLLNPAFVGSSGQTLATGNIRNHWVGIDGALESQGLIFDSDMGKNVGVGFSLINDRIHVEKQTSFVLDFSYRLRVSKTVDVYLGLKGGVDSYSVDTSGFKKLDADPLLSNVHARIFPKIGFGAYLKHRKYYLSFSIPKLNSTERLRNDTGALKQSNADRMSMYLGAGYEFTLGNRMSLNPNVMLRHIGGLPLSVDVSVIAMLSKHIGLGATYRLEESYGGLALVKLNWLDVGYAYEVSASSSINSLNNKGTHEILLRLKWPSFSSKRK